ncbi:hypothetical protein [Mycolicibacterium sp. S2-37]|nr:hypothetical protein [Mycolicibacterium sp. S2-37]
MSGTIWRCDECRTNYRRTMNFFDRAIWVQCLWRNIFKGRP